MSSSPQRIVCFDIGIKNLAWCCLEKRGESYSILGWDNVNLLSDSSNVTTKKIKCYTCSAKGVYEIAEGVFACSRHCSAAKPALKDASGNLLKKAPSVAVAREILLKRGISSPPKKKDDLIAALNELYVLPKADAKVIKAPDAGLESLHDSLRRLVLAQQALWSPSMWIGLENQPAFKNPTMKSVQMLLFATLRDTLQPNPPKLRLIHAGKKVQGATKGDAGYKDRKAGSEARAAAFLATHKDGGWPTFYASAAKKSDLADALAMCLDGFA